MRGALFASVTAALTIGGVALAGDYEPQDIPRAPMRVTDSKQGGRLAEASVSYRTGPDLCVAQGVIGDGTFPNPRPVVGKGPSERIRFRLSAERRPTVSLRYWTAVDEDGFAQGDDTPVPVEVMERKPNGDFILEADLDVAGERYLRLSAYWKGKGRCDGQEFLLNHYAVAPSLGR